MRFSLLFSCFSLASCLLCSQEALISHYSSIPPIIDGKLDEAAWADAALYDNFTVMQTERQASRRTELRILHTDTAMVFGFKAFVPADRLADEATAQSMKPYGTDCVEIMLGPDGGADSYFHFIVNSVNSRYVASREQGGFVGTTAWRCDWHSAVQRHEQYWCAEIALPYSSLELSQTAAAYWSFNAVRESYNLDSAGHEVSSLARRGQTHSAADFARLQRPGLDLSPYLWHTSLSDLQQKVRDGQLQINGKGSIRNLSEQMHKIKAELSFFSEQGQRFLSTLNYEARPLEAFELLWPSLQLPEPGRYQAAITLRELESNRILSRKHFDLDLNYVPMAITLVDPHYRQAIFATQKLEQINYQVDINLPEENIAGRKLHSGIRDPQSKNTVLGQTLNAQGHNNFSFKTADLPDGDWEVFAQLLDDQEANRNECTTRLRKLPYKKNEVWRDKDGHWRVDGERVFLLMCWGVGESSLLPEYNATFKQEGRYLNMFLNGKTGFGFGAAFWQRLKTEGASPETLELYRTRTKAAKDDPDLFGHYLVDEPDCTGHTRELFAGIAKVLEDEDPYHPIIISTGSGGIISYADCGEINGFHCYPNPVLGQPMSNFRKIVVLMDKARDFFATSPIKQSITYMHQGFNYGDCANRNTRIPSYEEFRNQNILSFVLGAVGLFHYNRTVEHYPELYLGLPHLVKEQKLIGEQAIIQPDAEVTALSSNAQLRLLSKANTDGSFWLLAASVSEEPLETEIFWPVWPDKEVHVLSEARQVRFKNSRLTESFRPFEVRVYTDSKLAAQAQLKTVSDINAIIEAEYARLAKPGNLAYQRFEGERLQVTASSNLYGTTRADNVLWHLTDGFTDGPVAKNTHSEGAMIYCDNTPDELPDWIELEFHEEVNIGKVLLYPVENSLLDYQLQVKKNGEYFTIADIKGADGEVLTHSFEPVRAKTLRLMITANRGKNSRLYEIEVYEK
ncbi:MAG: hypothetical protein GX574_10255 [Lentisphaerae bacterium]|nr:hypothetical protein [Lentisphaerota bacterium]